MSSDTFTRVKNTARNAFTTVGVLVVGGGVAAYLFNRRTRAKFREAAKLPSEFVLSLDFEEFKLIEKAGPPWQNVGQIGRGSASLQVKKLVDALHEASGDDRVKGLLTVVGANQGFEGLAQIQEVRRSILDFRNRKGSSAATLAYADSFGEGGSKGLTPYYLASASDKVVMQPMGLLSATGVGMQTPFIRRFFDQWDIKATFFKREGYKNFANTFTHETYSKEHREAATALISGWTSQMTAGISQARKLTEAQVKEAVDASPLSGAEAKKRGLLDDSIYRDQAVKSLVSSTDSKEAQLPVIPITKYIQTQEKLKKKTSGSRQMMRSLLKSGGVESTAETLSQKTKADEEPSKAPKPAVAVLTCVGGIVAGKGGQGLKRGPEIAAKAVSEELEKIRTNPAVKAVVLRVDSPGGSAVGSETIYRQILRLRESGTPVIVSMGNVAGSGGYYIAAPATKIVANPGTITGSIGVVLGKFNVDAPARKFGVNVETISQGKNADAFSPFSEFSDEQIAAVNRTIDDVYSGFIERVAKGRGKTVEEVRKIAGGRIWSGEDALKIGLVDKLGGLRDAIDLAKKEAGLPLDDDACDVQEFPRPKPLLALLVQQISGASGASNEVGVLQQAIATFLGTPTPELEVLSQTAEQLSKVQQAAELKDGPQLIVPELEHSRFV